MPIEFKKKCDLLTRALGWHKYAFMDADEAEAKEDLAEVKDSRSITIMEDQIRKQTSEKHTTPWLSRKWQG